VLCRCSFGTDRVGEDHETTTSRLLVLSTPPRAVYNWLLHRRRNLVLALLVLVVLVGLWVCSTSERKNLALFRQRGLRQAHNLNRKRDSCLSTTVSRHRCHGRQHHPSNATSLPKIAPVTYNFPDAHNTTLPVWMQDYIEFYHSQLHVSAITGEITLKPDANYLLWTCRSRPSASCGGIGDRLNGFIVKCLFVAICTNRVLLVDWKSCCSLHDSGRGTCLSMCLQRTALFAPLTTVKTNINWIRPNSHHTPKG